MKTSKDFSFSKKIITNSNIKPAHDTIMPFFYSSHIFFSPEILKSKNSAVHAHMHKKAKLNKNYCSSLSLGKKTVLAFNCQAHGMKHYIQKTPAPKQTSHSTILQTHEPKNYTAATP